MGNSIMLAPFPEIRSSRPHSYRKRASLISPDPFHPRTCMSHVLLIEEYAIRSRVDVMERALTPHSQLTLDTISQDEENQMRPVKVF